MLKVSKDWIGSRRPPLPRRPLGLARDPRRRRDTAPGRRRGGPRPGDGPVGDPGARRAHGRGPHLGGDTWIRCALRDQKGQAHWEWRREAPIRPVVFRDPGDARRRGGAPAPGAPGGAAAARALHGAGFPARRADPGLRGAHRRSAASGGGDGALVALRRGRDPAARRDLERRRRVARSRSARAGEAEAAGGGRQVGGAAAARRGAGPASLARGAGGVAAASQGHGGPGRLGAASPPGASGRGAGSSARRGIWRVDPGSRRRRR